jgi:hypothetical protein
MQFIHEGNLGLAMVSAAANVIDFGGAIPAKSTITPFAECDRINTGMIETFHSPIPSLRNTLCPDAEKLCCR